MQDGDAGSPEAGTQGAGGDPGQPGAGGAEKSAGKGPGGAAEQSGLLGDGMRGDRRRVRRGGVKDLKGRELLERLRKVESIPVKVYGQDGETICFEVQVGVAGTLVAVDKVKEKEE